MKKKMYKDALNLTKTGIVLGVGADFVGKVGGNAAGLNTLSGYTPVMGTLAGSGTTLKMLGNLIPKKRK